MFAQSPQIFKQLLMIAGFERYYQVARCFRDEDLRADRQLDFTQVDIEASFLKRDSFLEIIEKIVENVMVNVLGEEKPVVDRMRFEDAMKIYGSDKPDRRFEMTLQDLNHVFAKTEFKVFKNVLDEGGHLKAIVLKGGAQEVSRKVSDRYTELVKKYGLGGLVVMKYQNGEFNGPAKFFSEDELNDLTETLGVEENDVVFIGSGAWEMTCEAMGALRLQVAKDFDLIDKDKFDYLWVLDFPMFELGEEGELVARHHPFTSPKEEDIPLLDTDPLKVTAEAYDLVLNGYEIAGGSMRIYDQKLQKKMFQLIGFTDEQIKKRFGFFVEAFEYGTPPHGGIAFGLDRFAMALTKSDTIRDVIAFPKNASARCPLTMAPASATDQQLEDLHLEIVEKKKPE